MLTNELSGELSSHYTPILDDSEIRRAFERAVNIDTRTNLNLTARNEEIERCRSEFNMMKTLLQTHTKNEFYSHRERQRQQHFDHLVAMDQQSQFSLYMQNSEPREVFSQVNGLQPTASNTNNAPITVVVEPENDVSLSSSMRMSQSTHTTHSFNVNSSLNSSPQQFATQAPEIMTQNSFDNSTSVGVSPNKSDVESHESHNEIMDEAQLATLLKAQPQPAKLQTAHTEVTSNQNVFNMIPLTQVPSSSLDSNLFDDSLPLKNGDIDNNLHIDHAAREHNHCDHHNNDVQNELQSIEDKTMIDLTDVETQDSLSMDESAYLMVMAGVCASSRSLTDAQVDESNDRDEQHEQTQISLSSFSFHNSQSNQNDNSLTVDCARVDMCVSIPPLSQGLSPHQIPVNSSKIVHVSPISFKQGSPQKKNTYTNTVQQSSSHIHVQLEPPDSQSLSNPQNAPNKSSQISHVNEETSENTVVTDNAPTSSAHLPHKETHVSFASDTNFNTERSSPFRVGLFSQDVFIDSQSEEYCTQPSSHHQQSQSVKCHHVSDEDIQRVIGEHIETDSQKLTSQLTSDKQSKSNNSHRKYHANNTIDSFRRTHASMENDQRQSFEPLHKNRDTNIDRNSHRANIKSKQSNKRKHHSYSFVAKNKSKKSAKSDSNCRSELSFWEWYSTINSSETSITIDLIQQIKIFLRS